MVYEAEQVSLGRKVALKVLPFAAMMDKRQLQRFQNEARAAASLRHPNIVQVHFVGCERAVHFYAMDYIEGQTLADVIGYLRQPEETEDETPKKAGKAVSNLANSLTSGRFSPAKGSSDGEAPTEAYKQDKTPGVVGRNQAYASSRNLHRAADQEPGLLPFDCPDRRAGGRGVESCPSKWRGPPRCEAV